MMNNSNSSRMMMSQPEKDRMDNCTMMFKQTASNPHIRSKSNKAYPNYN